MSMLFSRAEMDCPFTELIGDRFRSVGDFHSEFFHLIGSMSPDAGTGDVLGALLRSEEFAKAVPTLVPLDLSAAKDFAVLNRYELEGSLVGALLQGTCTERVVSDDQEAIETARAILRETVLRKDGWIGAYRMNDPSWSALTNAATLSWAYFVLSSQNICWFVCFADPY
jgi:hypothetical protein